MELQKNTIPEILGLYEKYIKSMNIKDLPVLTVTKQEYYTALNNQKRINNADKSLKKSEPFGQTSYGYTDINGNKYNNVIFLNIPKFQEFKGLHEYSDPIITYKETKKYIYKLTNRKKIGHLEETLIHELLHVKNPKLRHGKKFNEIVRNIYLQNNKGINEKQT